MKSELMSTKEINLLSRSFERLPTVLREPLSRAACSLAICYHPDLYRLEINFRRGARSAFVMVRPLGDSAGAVASALFSTDRFAVHYDAPASTVLNQKEHIAVRRILEGVRRLLDAFERRTASVPAASRSAVLADAVFNTDAARVAPGGPGSGHEAILRVMFACNQNCGFCFVDLSKGMVPLSEIEKHLESMRPAVRRGEHLVISGGEPAAHPHLPQIIEVCRRKGFQDILLQTNAVHLSKNSLAQKLGRMSFLVSLHSHVPEIYDKLTRSRSQLPLALKGVRNILEGQGNEVILNIIVNRLNCAQLPDYVHFVDELRRSRPITIFFSMLNDVGLSRAPELGVDLAQAAPFVDEAVARCREKGIGVASFTGDCSIPVCQLGEPHGRAGKGGFAQDDVRYQAEFSHGDNRGRAKSPTCKRCIYDDRCRGVPVEYARRFGLAALEPVMP